MNISLKMNSHCLVRGPGWILRIVRKKMPLQSILDEVQAALTANLFYSAIAIALTLPEICAALETSSGSNVGRSAVNYKAWYNQYLSGKYPKLTADDCYSLRCGVVHQGRFGHPNMQYGRVIFSIPVPQKILLHNNIFNDALNLDAVTFCRDIIEAVNIWYQEKGSDENVVNNADLIVKLRSEGLAPYIVGIPVVA